MYIVNIYNLIRLCVAMLNIHNIYALALEKLYITLHIKNDTYYSVQLHV